MSSCGRMSLEFHLWAYLVCVSLGSTLCVGRLIYCFCLMVVGTLALEFELKVL